MAVAESESESRVLLDKDWSRFCSRRHQREMRAVDGAISSQQRALAELRKESNQLYMEAIQVREIGLYRRSGINVFCNL